MKNKIDQIITLDDNTKYMIVDQGNYNGKCYFLTSKLDENDNLSSELSILEETIKDGENYVESVKEEKLFVALVEYFRKRFVVTNN